MLEPIIIELEGAPIGKARPRSRRGQSRPYTPAKTLDYEASLRLAAQAVMGLRIPFDGPLIATIRAGMPIPASWPLKKRDRAIMGSLRPTAKPDADNILKIALDPLNGVVFHDDAQVVEATVTKVYAIFPHIRIEVRML